MGQKVGRMPQNEEALTEEWRRVLHWSAEVLARRDDNIDAEYSFLLDYDDVSIAAKVDSWLDSKRSGIDTRPGFDVKFAKLGNELKYKMRKDYEKAYVDLSRFARRVDELAEAERKIHTKILALEKLCPIEEKKFRRKLGRMRIKVFKNLRASEKMLFRDKRLKKEFVRRVYDIDHENMRLCWKKVKKLIEDFRENADEH